MPSNRVANIDVIDSRGDLTLEVVVDPAGGITAYRETGQAWQVFTDRPADRMLSRLLSGFLMPSKESGFNPNQCATAVGAVSALLSKSGDNVRVFDAAKQYLSATPSLTVIE